MDSSEHRLPNADQAVVSAAKVRDYLLNPGHPQGAHKARVFAAVLGLSQSDWPRLRDQILAEIGQAAAVHRGSTPWGELFEVAIIVRTDTGRSARVRTGWIVRAEDGRPHLTTVYVDLP